MLTKILISRRDIENMCQKITIKNMKNVPSKSVLKTLDMQPVT